MGHSTTYSFSLCMTVLFVCVMQYSYGHNQAQYNQGDQQNEHNSNNAHNSEQQRVQHPAAHHATAHSFGGDKDHVQEHLDGIVKPMESMTEDEIQFHYFKIHDYDGNNMLDGIELISALTDYHKEKEGQPDVEPLKETDIEELVDSMMNEDDLNGDGYIGYDEFMISQRKANEATSTS